MILVKWSGILAIEGRPTEEERKIKRLLPKRATTWGTPLPLMVPMAQGVVTHEVGGEVSYIERMDDQLRGQGWVYLSMLAGSVLTYNGKAAISAVGIDLRTPWDGVEFDEDRMLFTMRGSIHAVTLNEAPAWPECLIEIQL